MIHRLSARSSRQLVVLVLASSWLSGSTPAGPTALAQASRPDDWCRGDRGDRPRHCEVRELNLPGGALAVNASPNGGISVEGASRSDIHGWARVEAVADDEAMAQAIVAAVKIEASGGTLRAEGPAQDRDEHWSVSYRLSVPSRTDLTLETVNGGLSVSGVSGRLDLATINGGLNLREISGHVRGQTQNGGVSIDLSGDRWEGEGLDVTTRNGGVTLRIPRNYSANLETGTVNGGLSIDFPIVVQGTIGRDISTVLGSGGATLRARTTNGGVRIRAVE
jgi:hypothetical protein